MPRGEGLARFRAQRAAQLWPQLRAVLDKMLGEHGAPNAFYFAELSQLSAIPAREIGSVLRSAAAAEWVRERAARIETRGRATALVFGDADAAPGVGSPAPVVADAPADGLAVERAEGGGWLPSLL